MFMPVRKAITAQATKLGRVEFHAQKERGQVGLPGIGQERLAQAARRSGRWPHPIAARTSPDYLAKAICHGGDWCRFG